MKAGHVCLVMFPSPALNVPTVTWLLRALMRGKKIKQKQPCPPKALFKYEKKLLNTYVYFIRMEKNSLWAVFMYVYRHHHQEAPRTLCLQEQETLSKAYALIFT